MVTTSSLCTLRMHLRQRFARGMAPLSTLLCLWGCAMRLVPSRGPWILPSLTSLIHVSLSILMIYLFLVGMCSSIVVICSWYLIVCSSTSSTWRRASAPSFWKVLSFWGMLWRQLALRWHLARSRRSRCGLFPAMSTKYSSSWDWQTTIGVLC